jgi:hypothetical protein
MQALDAERAHDMCRERDVGSAGIHGGQRPEFVIPFRIPSARRLVHVQEHVQHVSVSQSRISLNPLSKALEVLPTAAYSKGSSRNEKEQDMTRTTGGYGA